LDNSLRLEKEPRFLGPQMDWRELDVKIGKMHPAVTARAKQISGIVDKVEPNSS
jgi:hypothetical protein